MKIRKSGILAFSALVVFGASEANAQDAEGRRGRGIQRGPDVESVMAMRDRLELTEAQIASLDALRVEWVQRRNADRAAMEEVRSQLRAGQIQRSEMMAFFEDRQEANAALATERRASLEGILNEVQLETIDDVRMQRRAFARGRASARRGGARRQGVRPQRFRGPRGERGAQRSGLRGARGPGGAQGQGIRERRRPGGVEAQGFPGRGRPDSIGELAPTGNGGAGSR